MKLRFKKKCKHDFRYYTVSDLNANGYKYYNYIFKCNKCGKIKKEVTKVKR